MAIEVGNFIKLSGEVPPGLSDDTTYKVASVVETIWGRYVRLVGIYDLLYPASKFKLAPQEKNYYILIMEGTEFQIGTVFEGFEDPTRSELILVTAYEDGQPFEAGILKKRLVLVKNWDEAKKALDTVCENMVEAALKVIPK